MYENLCKKFGITEDNLKLEGIDVVSKNLGQICNPMILLAVTELLVLGDIESDEKKLDEFGDKDALYE